MREKDRYKETTFPNGLKVLTYRMDSVLSAYAILYIRVGVVYESQKQRGISHFTEHAAFLGTKKHHSPLKISQEAQKLGAIVNGGVGRFSSIYWIDLPYTNIEKGIDLLYELSFKPVLNKRSLVKEKSVVLSEFNDFWHNPDARFGYEARKKRFKQEEHPYSFKPLGMPETIKNLNQDLIKSWRKKYFHPANMILSVAGKIEEKSVLPVIKNKFGKEKRRIKAKEPKFNSSDYSDFSIYLYKDPRPQIKFIVSFPAFGWRETERDEELKIRLLSYILGEGSASRLFQSLREKEKLVYQVESGVTLSPWMGILEIWGSTPKEKLIETLKGIKREIDKLCQLGINQEEMKLSKNFISASTLMRFDRPESIAKYFASQVFDEEKVWFPQDYIKEAEKISVSELNSLTKKIFDYSRINLNFLGDVSEGTLKEMEKIFKI